MSNARRLAISAAVAFALAAVIVAAVVLVLTNTDWGREHVRTFALGQLQEAAEGEVQIGRVEGNLLRRFRLVDVSIVDQQGRPFVRADTIAAAFSLRGLVRQRLAFRDVRLVNAEVVLDQPPGEDWNWVRIFPTDPDPVVVEPTRPGWGDWLELHNLVLVNTRVTIRTTWKPPEDLTPAERDKALRVALSEDSRENVVEVPGGFQNVMDFRELNGTLPYLQPSHPDRAAIPIEIASLSGIAQPFRPPVAVIHDLAGSVRIAQDSLFFDGVSAVLPGSRIAADGVYALDSGDLLLRLSGAPLAFADMRWLHPPLPEEGGGSLSLTVHRRTLVTRIVAEDMDLRVGDGTLAGRIDMTVGDTVRLQDTDLRFARLDTRLIERLAGDLELPRHGELTGRVQLAGRAEALQVDGDVTFADFRAGTSRVRAAGRVGIGDEIRFRDMRLRFEPLQAELVRAFAPQLPIRGTIEGYANLDGAATGPLTLDSDLTLRDPRSGLSRVRATGGVDTRGDLRLQNMLVRFEPLRLDLLRDQIPQLPRGALLAGQLRLHGVPERAMQVQGSLALTDPRSGVSRVGVSGGIATADEIRFRALRLRLEPLQLDLLQDKVPDLPAGATLAGPIRMDGSPAGVVRVDADLTLRDPATGASRVAVVGGIRTAEEVRLHDLRIRFDPLHLGLLRERFPELLPAGTIAGSVRLDGVPERMLDVDADVTHTDPRFGVSRVAATGGVGLGDELTFRALDLRFSPLRLALVRGFVPDLPLGGVLEGTATVTGSPATRLGFEADLAHQEAGERSRVVGRGEVVTGPGGWASVDVQLLPLSLATAGRFAPGAGLRGSARGRLQAQGDLGDLAISADLQAADGGELAVRGRLDLASDEPGYDIGLNLRNFDLASVTLRAPGATDLSGTASARGRGTDPATMNAVIAADLAGSRVDDVAADVVRLRLAVADGLAVIDDARVRIGTAEAEADGSFGLIAARHGELAFRVDVDSLHAFAGWVPGTDTGVAVSPTSLDDAPADWPMDDAAPADVRDVALADPSAAVERSGRVTRVQYPGAEQQTASQPQPVDTVPAAAVAEAAAAQAPAEPLQVAGPPADSLAGAVRAAGTLRGNIERFDATGTAEVERLVVAGNSVGWGRAEFSLGDVRSDALDLELDAEARSIRAAGFGFDSAMARVRYLGDRVGAGSAVVAAWQDDDTDFRLDTEFALALDRNELRLGEVELRFDTVTWQSTQPGVVSWGGAGIDVESLELRSNVGGRIWLDGRLPVEGAGNLAVELDDVEIGHLVTLLQDDIEAEGRLSLDATMRGTLATPRFEGDAALDGAVFNGRAWPETRATFAYDDLELTAGVQLLHAGRMLAVADATLPVNLSIAGDVEQRLLDRPLAVNLRADSLPLDIVPAFSDAVRDLRGRVVADIAVRGTFADPVVEGTADLDVGFFHLVPVGITFREIAGSLRMQGDAITVDSLVAWSGGPIRVAGTIGLPQLTEPVFDLEVEAREAWIVDTDDARLQVDADLEVGGSLAALEVSGEVRTRRGVIYIPELAEFGGGDVVNLDDPGNYARIDTLFAAERALLAADAPLLDNLQMDVAVVIDTDLWLRSTEANVEIYTPAEVGPLRIRMNGGPQTLALDGTVNTDRGDYEFMGRRFQLTRGAVTFLPGPVINPFIQVVAEHEVRLPNREGFEIRVILGGTLEDLAITLESSAQPPISQTDLMSYLAFGRESSSLLQLQGAALGGQGGGGGGLVGNVAALATQQLAAVALDELVRDIERDAARELGLDVIRVTPADLPAEVFTGSYIDVLRGTEVEAGRYVTPRLFVAGQARPTFVQPGALVEYRTPQGFVWRVTWQPRFLPTEPTLSDLEVQSASVFGSFLFREWRF